MKEADLYSYIFDPKKPPGAQDPFLQRIGAEKSGGRELRQRRARDLLDSAAPSEEDEEEDGEGRANGKRQRRATRRFDLGEHVSGSNTPQKKHNGWGGARKRGVSKYAQDASETPEPDGRAKRQKVVGSSLLHQRIQEMREASAVTSSGDEGSSQDVSANDDYRRRGRPAGSKNTGRRSDYGIKKGPRKKNNDVLVAPALAQAPNIPPPVLQSLSEGQGQFSIDPLTLSPHAMPTTMGTPLDVTPQPVSTVFQATPQPPSSVDPVVVPPPTGDPAPDAYMNTTPLSQYNHPYADDSSGTPGSSSKRKPRVKSEKRSQSMTIWWAERKARQKELGTNTTGLKPEALNPATPKPSGRRGGRPPSTSRPDQPLPPTTFAESTPPEFYQQVQPLPPPHLPALSAPSPNMAYIPTAPSPLQSAQVHMHNTPLAVLPSGPPPGPLPAHTMGPRSAMPPLAPAPMPPQPLNYPSPYGPRTAPRPKSSGPPLLAPAPAPAPAHVSPYPPPTMGPGMAGQGPVSQAEHREMPFKVLIPGPPPGISEREEERRTSTAGR